MSPTSIKREEMELIREWIIAEINSCIAANEEDSEGYRGNNYNESRYAKNLYEKICELFCSEQKQ